MADKKKKELVKTLQGTFLQEKKDPLEGGMSVASPSDFPIDTSNIKNAGTDAVKTFTDVNTGRGTGVTIRGRTFFGVNEEDIRNMTAAENQKRAALGQPLLPVMSQAKAVQLEEQQRKGIGLAQGIGTLNPDITSQKERQGLDLKQLGGAAVGGIAPSVAGGAVAGGAAIAGVGAATGGLAIAGLSALAITRIASNLKAQQQGKITAGGQSLKDNQQTLNKLITLSNTDPANADIYAGMFNEQLSYIERDYGILQLDTEGFLKDITGADGTPQLADYQRFYDSQRDLYITRMQAALINPNPTSDISLLEAGVTDETAE